MNSIAMIGHARLWYIKINTAALTDYASLQTIN